MRRSMLHHLTCTEPLPLKEMLESNLLSFHPNPLWWSPKELKTKRTQCCSLVCARRSKLQMKWQSSTSLLRQVRSNNKTLSNCRKESQTSSWQLRMPFKRRIIRITTQTSSKQTPKIKKPTQLSRTIIRIINKSIRKRPYPKAKITSMMTKTCAKTTTAK